MKYLLDTNIISEPLKNSPHAGIPARCQLENRPYRAHFHPAEFAAG